jgi:subtilase family serine protease
MKRVLAAVLSVLSIAAAVAVAQLIGPSAARSDAATAVHHLCAAPRHGYARCLALARSVGVRHATAGTPSGYGPADLRSAYHLSASAGAGKAVAIVDAYDDRHAEADLAKYRATYHLPACTTANGCFSKVSQTGSRTSLPAADTGWAGEISLDLDMVSASCPACHILLVEARTASMSDLATAVNYAASRHVAAISNSYGGPETAPSSAYKHPGIAITASAGDDGYAVESPASFASVIAVGGTSLRKTAGGRGWAEAAWSGSGSGCATRSARPTWQPATTSCPGRAVADVAAVADPATGVAVFDSVTDQGASGWQVYGGTSASAPIIAAVYAMSAHRSGNPASWTWAHASGLNDVTSGANGSCRTASWCHAGKGWDGPTGLGTPNGTAAF